MSNLTFIIIAVLVIIGIAIFLLLLTKSQKQHLKTIALNLINEAEGWYESGQGEFKLSFVFERLEPHIPPFLRPFITETSVKKIIENVLPNARKIWANTKKE